MTMAMPRVSQAASNWWKIALRGAVAILFGLLALSRPGITFAAIVGLVGAYLLVDGVLTVVASIRVMREYERWGWTMIAGIVSIGAGLIVFATPAAGAMALVWLVALWAIVHGILEILAGIRLRKIIQDEWLLILAGALALALGILILMRPGLGAVLLMTWIGVYALLAGIAMLMLSFRIRKWSNEHPA
jgi:uncharacterized membrane protein HdeD (DUF308 family)